MEEFAIKNYTDVYIELKSMLKELDREPRNYQIDIYMYLNDSGDATLYEYPNIGGNNWLNDDHITIYSAEPNNRDFFEIATTIADLSESISLPLDELERKTRDFLELDDYERINYSDIKAFIQSDEELMNNMKQTYYKTLDEMSGNSREYEEKAESILSENNIVSKEERLNILCEMLDTLEFGLNVREDGTYCLENDVESKFYESDNAAAIVESINDQLMTFL